MAKPFGTNCAVCQWRSGSGCSYWDLKNLSVAKRRGLTCPDPKRGSAIAKAKEGAEK